MLYTLILLQQIVTHQFVKGLYPDYKLTPGEVDPKVTAEMVCKPGYSATVRAVPESEHKKVFARYGIDWKDHAKYEVDHKTSLELGGTNSLANLWPQPYAGVEFTARQKDEVEDDLHRRVCHGKITLKEAQRLISEDWVAEYKKCCLGKGL
jgi:hypothetical protein